MNRRPPTREVIRRCHTGVRGWAVPAALGFGGPEFCGGTVRPFAELGPVLTILAAVLGWLTWSRCRRPRAAPPGL